MIPQRYHDAHKRRLAETAPDWLTALRRTQFERFAEFGLPTTKHEAWRYSNLKFLANDKLEVLDKESALDLPSFTSDLKPSGVIVMRDGFLDAGLSSLPDGVTVSLATERQSDPQLLGSVVPPAESALSGLVAGLAPQPVIIEIASGISLDGPLHFRSVRGSAGESFAHIGVRVGKASSLSICATWEGVSESQGIAHQLFELDLHRGAQVSLMRALMEPAGTYPLALAVRVGDDAKFGDSFTGAGSAWARNEINVDLAGQGSECTLDAAFVPTHREHMDNTTVIRHSVAHTKSQQEYRGVLGGHSTGVFNGKVYVAQDAQQVDANQLNRNVLLAPTAAVYTRPQLEIYANDVKCAHGATTGQLDPEQLYYLTSRGIAEARARGMLAEAFCADLINRIEHEPFRTWVSEQIDARFHQDP